VVQQTGLNWVHPFTVGIRQNLQRLEHLFGLGCDAAAAGVVHYMLLANRHNQSYTIRKKPLEPKFHLALAFTCKTPALQRNVVQYWEMDQEFGKSTTHRLWSSYTPWNKTQSEVCYQKKSDGTKIPSSTGHYMRNAGIVEKCGTIFFKWIRILEPRPSTGYKGDILLVHRHNLKSAITK
jgi:hypothetical protein